MRNLDGKGYDVRYIHHWCEYRGYAYKYMRNYIRYLHDNEEIDSDIKKDRHNSTKVSGLF